MLLMLLLLVLFLALLLMFAISISVDISTDIADPPVIMCTAVVTYVANAVVAGGVAGAYNIRSVVFWLYVYECCCCCPCS